MKTMISTITVEIIVSRRVGHVTFAVSARTCCKNVNGLVLEAIYRPYDYGTQSDKSAPRTVYPIAPYIRRDSRIHKGKSRLMQK
jgi:hypothetical protein